ncbi:serine/threonine-protein kinase [Kineosporia sp. R_H_3]|uniref:serine/threonine-protein kinase n=1 Tax=Kineosporia sp. R_H_3 TaxID=1961848 RepID=UPI000B4B09A1|nr:serine/threonine-protein kinase [Kineosporia sp. R_H_3]
MGGPGHRVVGGRYQLADLIGRGGMGSVWRAEDTVLSRQVAVKVVERSATADPGEDVLARGAREARAAARLNHPHAVTVHDVVEEGDRCAIVMELVDAPTLGDLVRMHGPLAPQRVAAIGLQLVDVLGAAHAAGIVHRDVKPSNVMLLPDDRVKLTDFGIASLQGDPQLTRPGTTMGSPRFMAPEQATGETVGPPADWWALAATLYFAVEGRPPYDRESAQAVVAALLCLPPDPLVLAGPLTPMLSATLVRDPADRPGVAVLRTLLGLASGDSGAEDRTQGARTVELTQPAAPAAVTGPGPAGSVLAEPARPVLAEPGRADAGRPERRSRRRRAALLVLAAGAVAVTAVLGADALRAWQDDAPPGRSPAAAADPGPTSGRATGEEAGPVSSVAAVPDPVAAVSDPSGFDDLANGPAGRPGARTARSSTIAAAGQNLPRFTLSATNTDGGYAIAVPSGWDVVTVGASTFVDWNDTMFASAFEVRSMPAADPWATVQKLEKTFAAAHSADGYERVSLTDRWTYAGRPAAQWEFTWQRNGVLTHARVVAFSGRDRTYTVLYRSKDVWWLGGGSDRFPTDFERGFTLLP